MSESTDMIREIHLASDEQDVLRCWNALKELRPHIATPGIINFQQIVNRYEWECYTPLNSL